MGTERNDDVSILHGWPDEVVIRWFDEAIVLGQHVDNGATAISNIPLDYLKEQDGEQIGEEKLTSAGKTNIIRCEHENLEVHLFAETILNDGMNTFEDNDGSGTHGLRHIGAFVKRKVVSGNLTVFTIDQFGEFLVTEVEVEGRRVIKVVVCGVIVILVPSDSEYSLIIEKKYLREALVEHIEG